MHNFLYGNAESHPPIFLTWFICTIPFRVLL